MGAKLEYTVLLRAGVETFQTGDIVQVKYKSGYFDLLKDSLDDLDSDSEKVVEGRLITPSSTSGHNFDKIDIDVSKEFDSHIEHICIDDIISIRKIK